MISVFLWFLRLQLGKYSLFSMKKLKSHFFLNVNFHTQFHNVCCVMYAWTLSDLLNKWVWFACGNLLFASPKCAILSKLNIWLKTCNLIYKEI